MSTVGCLIDCESESPEDSTVGDKTLAEQALSDIVVEYGGNNPGGLHLVDGIATAADLLGNAVVDWGTKMWKVRTPQAGCTATPPLEYAVRQSIRPGAEALSVAYCGLGPFRFSRSIYSFQRLG